MTRKEGIVERSERITTGVADKMVDDIRRLTQTLQVRPWGASHLTEAQQLAAWESIRGDSDALAQIIAREQAGLHLPLGVLPKRLMREMETMEKRYQAANQGQLLAAAIPAVAPQVDGLAGAYAGMLPIAPEMGV